MELYHVVNRGVDGRNIFLNSQDYARFVHDLYEFNDTAPAKEYSRLAPYVGRATSHINISSTIINEEGAARKRERIINLHAWCLMKNHYHLLISERLDGGLTLFLRKMSGYGRYFNERHKRSGTLLQRTKKVLVNNDAHFLYILHYLHLNPLDYLPATRGWRERDKDSIANVKKALAYLDTYRWSSFLDYCGTKNFPSVITTSLFEEIFPNYRQSVTQYLHERADESLVQLHLE